MENSLSNNSEVNSDDDDEAHPFDENNIVEIMEEDEASGVIDSEEDEVEEQDVIPDRDDAQIMFSEHEGCVLSCAFHPKSSNIVATGGIDDKAYIWDSANGNKLFTCSGHEDSVEIVAFNHDGLYLATADLNGVIKVWNTKNFDLEVTLELEDELGWLQWHYGTNALVASSQIGMIYMYRIPSGECRMVSAPFGHNCLAGKILPDGKSLACGYKDGNLKILDLKQGVVVKDVKPYDEIGGITCLDVHKSNYLIICGCESGAILMINSNSGKVVSVLQGSQNSDGSDYVEAVSFCKDPSYPVAASGCLNGNLTIWDITKQTMRHKYSFSSCVSHLAWHPSQPVLFTCHVEGVARAYDAKAGVILREYLGHKKSCLNMSLSGDGTLLMTTSEDKTVRIFCVCNIF